MASEQQPFIPYVEENDYPANLKPVLDPYVKRMGFLPNALKLYMHRPEIAETLWKLNSNVMRDPSSTLDQGLKRRLATVASNVNGCTYCTSHHCAILKSAADSGAEGWGMTHEDLTASPARRRRAGQRDGKGLFRLRASRFDGCRGRARRHVRKAQGAADAATDCGARLRGRILEDV